MKHNYKAISLFAGVGGICLGFMKQGVKIVFANDFDKNACITYRENFEHGITEGPIENVKVKDIPEADLVLFGFPCTSFSVAGHRKGFDDEKSGHLFFEALRIIKAKKPKAFFLENVKNLVGHDGGRTFNIITDELAKEGYHFRYQVMNSMEYGNVPQNRERIYIVGFKSKSACDKFYFPDPILLKTKIADITKPNEKKDDKFYYENSKYYPMLKEAMVKKDTIYQLRRVYVRENKSNVCPTLTANMGTGGHNVPLILDDYGIRKLTPRECFELQGFPKSYKLPEKMANCHLYKQAGNSVTISVIERIAENIIKVLEQENSNIVLGAEMKEMQQIYLSIFEEYNSKFNKGMNLSNKLSLEDVKAQIIGADLEYKCYLKAIEGHKVRIIEDTLVYKEYVKIPVVLEKLKKDMYKNIVSELYLKTIKFYLN